MDQTFTGAFSRESATLYMRLEKEIHGKNTV